MLTHIELRNFKCLGQVSLDPRRITVLIGPNGSGKSSLLQSLVLLKQSLGQHSLRAGGDFINVGDSLADLVTRVGSKTLQPVEIQIGGTSPQEPETSFMQRLNFNASGNVVRMAAHFVYTMNGGKQTLEARGEPGYGEVKPPEISIPPVTYALAAQTTIGWPIVQGGTSISAVDQSQRARVEMAQERLQEVLKSIADFLQNLVWIPAMRGFVQPAYPLASAIKPEATYLDGLNAYFQQVASNLEYRRDSERRIWDLMERVTGVGISTRMVPPQRVQVVAQRHGLTANIVNEGFGTNQLVVLLESFVSAARSSTILIEEPEIHLHPRAQADLASVLVEEAKKEAKQIIFTTHGEHMLHRLLTLVASKALAPEELAVYAFELGGDGIATAQPLEVDERGRIKGGLKGFFEVELEELDQYMKALGQWKARSAKSSS